MSNNVGYKLEFYELVCTECGSTYIGKSKARKFCDECRRKRHLASHRESWKRCYERDKVVNAIVIPAPVEKPKFTLAEVNAAAKKNRMTYGNYVYQWAIGRVQPPEKFPAKKKRGRKKNDGK